MARAHPTGLGLTVDERAGETSAREQAIDLFSGCEDSFRARHVRELLGFLVRRRLAVFRDVILVRLRSLCTGKKGKHSEILAKATIPLTS